MIFSPGEVKEIDVEFPSPLGVLGLTTSRTICSSPGSMRFPSPLGVLGLTTTRISAKPVSAIQFPSPLGVLGLTTESSARAGAIVAGFPSPLGVLGLIREIHCALFKVSVPSRGFGSDDIGGPGEAGGGFTRFRPLSGFWV
ncbi:Uncharacterised protein [Mycobacterium tuberculosis]|nr:Uncharacterised protein [Mycobacterium tuberculosis]